MSVSRPEHVDTLIVGGGLSGIGAACRLQQRFPGRSYAVLEARGAVGGTWDLFRYPGVRSDSDMATLGYPFRPWHDVKTLGSGAGATRRTTPGSSRTSASVIGSSRRSGPPPTPSGPSTWTPRADAGR